MDLPIVMSRRHDVAPKRTGSGGVLMLRFIVRRLLPFFLLLTFGFMLFYSPPERLRRLPSASSAYIHDHLQNQKWYPASLPKFASSSAAQTDRIPPSNRTARPRAAFVSLVRERNLDGLMTTIRDLQWAFNDDPANAYDYILLSETPFSDWFKGKVMAYLAETVTKPNVHFGVVDQRDWKIPDHIDLEKAKARWETMALTKVPYGGSQSYRQMCRYYSGPIFHHPLLQNLDYVWRIEADTKHLCRYVSQWQRGVKGERSWLERDPFRYMKENGKKYAWVITLLEYTVTVRTLMVHVNWWMRDNAQLVAPNNMFGFISDDGKGYNKCHFWTNFEIVDLSFVRSQAYQSLFDSLDKAGGFFMERWGDAPVRSIAASILLNKDEIWHVETAGYHHPPYTTCPRQQDPGSQCACDPHISIDYDATHVSCMAKWDDAIGRNSTEVILKINEENGMGHLLWKPDEQPHVLKPERLRRPD